MRQSQRIALLPDKAVKSLIYKVSSEDNTGYKYKLSIVVIIKNEALYIREWIDYHILVGVEYFYIYDNESTDNTKDLLSEYIKRGLVTYQYYPGRAKQLASYNDAIRKHKHETKYMAFIDADEFIMPVNKEDSIFNIIDDVITRNKASGIAINWRMFGSSGKDGIPKNGGVLNNFVYRAAPHKPGQSCIKTVANPRAIFHYNHDHFPEYLFGGYSVDETGKRVSSWNNDIDEPNRIKINHYFTKSKEEWIKRRKLGRADSRTLANSRGIDEFYSHDNNDIYDNQGEYYYLQLNHDYYADAND